MGARGTGGMWGQRGQGLGGVRGGPGRCVWTPSRVWGVLAGLWGSQEGCVWVSGDVGRL